MVRDSNPADAATEGLTSPLGTVRYLALALLAFARLNHRVHRGLVREAGWQPERRLGRLGCRRRQPCGRRDVSARAADDVERKADPTGVGG